MKYINILTLFCILVLLCLTACSEESESSTSFLVVLRVDEIERAYRFTEDHTVADLLSKADLTLNEGDHLSHSMDASLDDGMIITVQKSGDWTDCVLRPIPYGEIRLPNELLSPGEIRLGPGGKDGIERVCTYFQVRDGGTNQTEIRSEIVEPAIEQITFFGVDQPEIGLPINGTVSYISHGTVWIMRDNSDHRNAITQVFDADGHVFELSPDGESLLFTRRYEREEKNQLWLLRSTSDLNLPSLQLDAHIGSLAFWHPGEHETIFTFHEVESPTLQRHQLDLRTGVLQTNETVHLLLDPSSEKRIILNNEGTQVAFSGINEIGTINLRNGETYPLSFFGAKSLENNLNWVPEVSWSYDDKVLITTKPATTENQPNRYDIVAYFMEDEIRVTLFENVGQNAIARYSPRASTNIAFTQNHAGHYALFISDQDASNERLLFPISEDIPIADVSEFSWSPNGQQLLAVADGNLWLIEVDSGQAWQLTGDGGVSAVDWAP